MQNKIIDRVELKNFNVDSEVTHEIIKLPKNTEILSVTPWGRYLFMQVMYDAENENVLEETVEFVIYKLNYPIPVTLNETFKFLTTTQYASDTFVVFYKKS